MDTSALFLTGDGDPCLQRSAVLFLDLLGVREMSRSADAAEHLTAIARAVSGSYRDFLRPDSAWPAALFSDTLVLAAPIAGEAEDERAAVSGLITQAALLQLELAGQGLFVRGALAIGDFHIHNGLVFGAALVSAYELESKHALHPRVILDEAAEECQRTAHGGPLDDEEDLHASMLLCDDDGWTFVDYLAILFDEPEDPRPRLRTHRETLLAKLAEYSGERRLWEKYRWVAEYHNNVIADRLPGESDLLVQREAITWRFRRFPCSP